MTYSSTNVQQGNSKGKNKPSRGQSNPSQSSKKNMEELITPETLLLLSAASVSQKQKGKNNKQQHQNNFSVDADSIPTKETPDILAMLQRNDNAMKLQSSPPRNINSGVSSHRPSSPPTRDTQMNNRPRRNSPLPSTSPSNNSSNCQRWAGASYANSPAPSQLPKPVFGNNQSETFSSAVRQLDFSEVEVPHQEFHSNHSLPFHHTPIYHPPAQPQYYPHQPNFYYPHPPVTQHFVDPVFHQTDNAHLSNHLKLMLNIGSN